ncbi:hyaluronidase-like isoform X2 [Gordionus sp. m RMFG-2023]|uniref:hyaluronidase-like isoform X2 n=1 Tax=Gordionus sp. m RMFG-2023 TaxID=3053472 RepID=UPI0031FDE19A
MICSCRNFVLLILIGIIALFIQEVLPIANRVPFRIIWNSPTFVCKSKYKVSLNLAKWGIESNVNQAWQSDTVSLFYATIIGLWAFIRNGRRINGGIPERMDIYAHVNKTIADVQRILKKSDFSGLGVIDMEFYTPLWKSMMNPVYSIYVNESLSDYKSKENTSGLNDTTIRLRTQLRYESAIRNIMQLTLETVKKERPGGLWGYFGYPRCANNHNSYQCISRMKSGNQSLNWLYESSTALYPAHYINRNATSLPRHRARQLIQSFFIQDVMPLNKNVPFRVIWNSPTHVCKSRYNVILNLDKWGIESNVNQTWQNATVTLFYATVIGLWAFINNNGTRVNGGIPERMNITAHANETIADIQRVMKNTNFSGLAVIDMEFYTPLWQLMMDPVYQIYIDESIDYFKTQMNTSGLDDTAIRLGARQNYESVIKNMMILTLRVAKQNRPYALWGYYAFPKCAPSLVSYQCDIVQNNQAISWLYEASTALYPAFYINRIGDPLYHARTRQLIQLMNEAQRISASRINGPIPVYLYVRYAYVKENKTLLDYFDLKNIFAQAVDMAQDGIVFWGDYADFGNCKALSTHMEKLIGPLVKQSINFANEF